MNNLTKLLTFVLVFMSFTIVAQNNDTLKIKRNYKGIITFINLNLEMKGQWLMEKLF